MIWTFLQAHFGAGLLQGNSTHHLMGVQLNKSSLSNTKENATDK